MVWGECSRTEAVSFTAGLVSSALGELTVTHPVRNARYLFPKTIKAPAAFRIGTILTDPLLTLSGSLSELTGSFPVCRVWRLEVISAVFSSHTRTGRGGLASSWLPGLLWVQFKAGQLIAILASLPLNSMCHEGAVQNNENRITYKAPSPYPLSVSELHTCTFDSHGASYLCTVLLRVLRAFLTPHCSVSQELDLSFLVYSRPHFMVQR